MKNDNAILFMLGVILVVLLFFVFLLFRPNLNTFVRPNVDVNIKQPAVIQPTASVSVAPTVATPTALPTR